METQPHQSNSASNREKEEEEETRLPPPEYAEVIKALQNLKNWKEPEEDAITTKLLKSAGTECQIRIYNLILKI